MLSLLQQFEWATEGFAQDQMWESGRPNSHLVIGLSLPCSCFLNWPLSVNFETIYTTSWGVENQGRFPFLLPSRAVDKNCSIAMWKLTDKKLGRWEPLWSGSALNQTVGLHHQLSRLRSSFSDLVGLPLLVLPLMNFDWYARNWALCTSNNAGSPASAWKVGVIRYINWWSWKYF